MRKHDIHLKKCSSEMLHKNDKFCREYCDYAMIFFKIYALNLFVFHFTTVILKYVQFDHEN